MDDQQQTPFAAVTPDAPVQASGRNRRRVAILAATALVAGVCGVGAGYAVGNGAVGSSPATASSGTRSTPGSGDEGRVTAPVQPYDGPFAGRGQRSEATTRASASQLTGLVRIVTTMKYAGARAAGTGMVLTSDGQVVTNHHVVEGATSISVKVMTTGRTYVATVVGTDAEDDVAVLQLTGASGLSTVTVDTDGVSVGDDVIAVGDANGTVSHLSAAPGEVLALHQSITTQSERTAEAERLTGMIKISSDVVSGDSGGATYDEDGEVVGMTTAASSGGVDIDGYAVPIATVLSVAEDLENGVTGPEYDYGRPAFLGVALGGAGTTVVGVYEGTPAATVGIRAGDRITKVGTTHVRTPTQLHNAIADLSPGDTVGLSWSDSAGTAHTTTVTLATGPVE